MICKRNTPMAIGLPFDHPIWVNVNKCTCGKCDYDRSYSYRFIDSNETNEYAWLPLTEIKSDDEPTTGSGILDYFKKRKRK